MSGSFPPVFHYFSRSSIRNCFRTLRVVRALKAFVICSLMLQFAPELPLLHGVLPPYQSAIAQRRKPAPPRKTPPRKKPQPRKPAPRKNPSTQALQPRLDPIHADSTTIVELADGVTHRRIITNGSHVVNVITVDLQKNARLKSIKALNQSDGLESVRSIVNRAADSLADTVLAGTNASFWRAGMTTPIGITISNGEAIEMPGYKGWSTLLLYEDGSAAIDRLQLAGRVLWKHRNLKVEAINRRSDEPGIVVYNHFFGASVPRETHRSDSAIIAEVLANRVTPEQGDETETIDTAQIVRDYRLAEAMEDQEHSLLKIACVFPQPKKKRSARMQPVIGDTMRLIVTKIDTGIVEIPENGFVLSLGADEEWLTTVQPGDTVRLLYQLTSNSSKKVRDAITSTPRIVRDGIPGPEHPIEGSKARRFVEGKLSRSAVGISQRGNTLFLATVDSPHKEANTTGMTLRELAEFMASIGAYQALNLDGGGSATMVVNGETISRQGGRPFNRRVSNALVVVKPAPQATSAPRSSRN